jgi:hypothetical protein
VLLAQAVGPDSEDVARAKEARRLLTGANTGGPVERLGLPRQRHHSPVFGQYGVAEPGVGVDT